MRMREVYRVVRDSGDSRIVQTRDGFYWAQAIYRDSEGRKCWGAKMLVLADVYAVAPGEGPLRDVRARLEEEWRP